MDSLRMQPRRFFLKAVSGDSDTNSDKEMEPVHLADNFHKFNDIHGFFSPKGDLC